MNIKIHNIKDQKVAEIQTEHLLFGEFDSSLDLIGNLYYQEFETILVYEKNVSEDFFDLKNRMAGEILQKFSNYRMSLFIVGNFEKYTKSSIKAFIAESNRLGHVNFVDSIEEAFTLLT